MQLTLIIIIVYDQFTGTLGFFLTVRAGTAYWHLFSRKRKKIICNVYY